jgi:nickel/cobalt transporter (NicO) family protein
VTGSTLLSALVAGAATVGCLHTLAPDHWMPFAALGRANRWPARRLVATTMFCGLGHVTVSAILSLIAAYAGVRMFERIGARLAEQATFLLIVFGALYLMWGLRRSFSGHHHRHWHGPLTAGSLFVIFSLDICVALMPLVFAALTKGPAAVAAVIITYELATIGTMVALVLLSHHGTQRLHFPWIDRFGQALAGGVIVMVGSAMVLLGI